MRRVLCFGLALVLSACAAAADVGALSAEFKVLRAQSGHFSGGEWNEAADKFGGRKHEVMLKLEAALGDGTHTRAGVVALLGEPDVVVKSGETLFRDSYNGGDPRVTELLVYQWRGMHDYLFFTSDGTQVLGSAWWNAWE
ncbi:MAG: hypothetical protein ACKVRO_03975 [Micropepsaceae bacterium]